MPQAKNLRLQPAAPVAATAGGEYGRMHAQRRFAMLPPGLAGLSVHAYTLYATPARLRRRCGIDAMSLENAPHWWTFELELSPHVEERMIDRGFTEIDLRLMIELSDGLRPSPTPGRWVVAATHEGEPWEVIVEPDESNRVIVVITAYRVRP